MKHRHRVPNGRAMTSRRLAGFSLVEVLVTLLVTSLGLLALARAQAGLFSASDTAKHRAEATRLAQDKMEALRAFTQMDATASATVVDYTDVMTGSDAVTGTSNVEYTRNWNVVGANSDPYKTLVMRVSWTNRANQQQEAVLRSVIAAIDPKSAGALTIAPNGSPVKRPRNRDINVPFPAVDIGTGRSAIARAGGDSYYVFDNATGVVGAICAGPMPSAGDGACADNVAGLLVTGFIRFDTRNNPSAQTPSGTGYTTLGTSAGVAFASSPALAASNVPVGQSGPLIDCSTSPAPASSSVAYVCVVYYPAPGTPIPPPYWSGRLNVTGFAIGTGGTDHRVCRYSYDYNGNGSIDNAEHPAVYTSVTENLENQNFLVLKSSASCPADNTVPDSESNPVNYNTSAHQP